MIFCNYSKKYILEKVSLLKKKKKKKDMVIGDFAMGSFIDGQKYNVFLRTCVGRQGIMSNSLFINLVCLSKN